MPRCCLTRSCSNTCKLCTRRVSSISSIFRNSARCNGRPETNSRLSTAAASCLSIHCASSTCCSITSACLLSSHCQCPKGPASFPFSFSFFKHSEPPLDGFAFVLTCKDERGHKIAHAQQIVILRRDNLGDCPLNDV